MQKILYEDDHVRIDRDQITIIQYYFPIPMDKTIKMKDIECVGLKYDIDKDKKYIEIIVKGFSLNATLSPEDPNKVMAIIQTYSSMARSRFYANLQQKEQINTQIKQKVYQPKQQDVRDIQPTAEDARKQNLQYQNLGVIQSVTHSISHGWDVVKQSAHNIYEATTEKLHLYPLVSQIQKKTQQIKQDSKQGVQQVKQGGKQIKKDVEQKIDEGKIQAKQKYDTAKQKASQNWENIQQGTTQMVGEDGKNKGQNAPYKSKQGLSYTADSVKKGARYQRSYLLQGKQNHYLSGQNIKRGALNTADNTYKKFQNLTIEQKNKPYVYKTDPSLRQKSFNITG